MPTVPPTDAQAIRRCVVALVTLTFLYTTNSRATAAATKPNRSDQQLVVHTLANEGVALTDGSQTVLIDALFDEGVRGYQALDAVTQARLIEGALELPTVTLVLATHVHRDHFDANVVLDFLARNPEARFIGPPQTVRSLRKALRGSSQKVEPDEPAHRANLQTLEGRMTALLPQEGNVLELDREALGPFDGKVTLLNLHHGRDRDPPIENLGVLIEIAGLRALHIGDTEVRLADVDALPWESLQVDIALFPYWFLVKSHYLQVTRTINPKHVVALHVPALDAPVSYFRPARSLEGLRAAILAEFPEALIALRPGQREIYRHDKSLKTE